MDLANGRTLCVPCHKATPTYGSKARRAKRLSQEVLDFEPAPPIERQLMLEEL